MLIALVFLSCPLPGPTTRAGVTVQQCGSPAHVLVRRRVLIRYLPQQSAYNKRLNASGPLISHVLEALAQQVPTWHDDPRLIDSTPLPRAASRETVKRSDLAGHAGYGYCRSHSRYFWGFRLYLLTTAEDMWSPGAWRTPSSASGRSSRRSSPNGSKAIWR